MRADAAGRAMLIAQISDFHVTVEGSRAYDRVDTGAALARAVETLNALSPQPDLVLCTGDLTQNGTREEYERLRQLLGGLNAPFVPVLGNHDDRIMFRAAFADFGIAFEPASFIQYVVDDYPVCIVVLDTVLEGAGDPAFCEARAQWLRRELDRADRPVQIAIHHPPFRTGLSWLDPADAGWSDPIGLAVRGRAAVRRIVCGHVHRPIQRLWHGVMASTAPATAHQVFLDLTPGSPPLLSQEAPGFQLHHCDGEDFTTYTGAIPGFLDTFPST